MLKVSFKTLGGITERCRAAEHPYVLHLWIVLEYTFKYYLRPWKLSLFVGVLATPLVSKKFCFEGFSVSDINGCLISFFKFCLVW